MKILVYSAKDFEIPFMNRANRLHLDIEYTMEPLNINTAHLTKGFQCISVFTNDDVSAHVLREVKLFGVNYIAIRAAGFDNIDLSEAESLGLKVANVPEYSPYAIAEHAIALLLALNRKLIIANEQVRSYNFSLGNLMGFDLHKKTIGLIGTGRIGSIMAKIMHGFGADIIAYDISPTISLTEKYNVRYTSLQDICQISDIISIHIPLNTHTKYVFNEKLFSIMKKGVIIINTARGAIINTSDLMKYLDMKIIGAYGGDVYENEKGIFFFDHSKEGIGDRTLKDLLTRKNVLITPHQGFATYEALTNIADTTFANIIDWSAGVTPENEISHNPSFISYAK